MGKRPNVPAGTVVLTSSSRRVGGAGRRWMQKKKSRFHFKKSLVSLDSLQSVRCRVHMPTYTNTKALTFGTGRRTVCFPGTCPCEASLLLTRFMYCAYPHQITALWDHTCSPFQLLWLPFFKDSIITSKKKKKRKANIHLWANVPSNVFEGDGLQWACWFLCVVAHLVGIEWVFLPPPTLSALLCWSHPCSCSKFLLRWGKLSTCVFSVVKIKLQQSSECATCFAYPHLQEFPRNAGKPPQRPHSLVGQGRRSQCRLWEKRKRNLHMRVHTHTHTHTHRGKTSLCIN